MTQPPDRPLGIPGAPPLGQGPSLTKPAFQAPLPPVPQQGGEAMVLAGWGARFGAVIIDVLVRWILALVISVVGFVLFADDPFSTTWVDPEDEIANLGGIFIVAFVLYYALALIYAPPFMARWNGATPGKRMVGIRVVTEAGFAPSFGQAYLREVVFKGIVIGLIGGTFFFPWVLNYLWPLWDEQSRAGHDFMARTRVVRA